MDEFTQNILFLILGGVITGVSAILATYITYRFQHKDHMADVKREASINILSELYKCWNITEELYIAKDGKNIQKTNELEDAIKVLLPSRGFIIILGDKKLSDLVDQSIKDMRGVGFWKMYQNNGDIDGMELNKTKYSDAKNDIESIHQYLRENYKEYL